jgi:hypothetical protein
MSTAALLLSLVALALAQDAPKTIPKPFKEPARPELAENALLARDEGCAKRSGKGSRTRRHRASEVFGRAVQIRLRADAPR